MGTVSREQITDFLKSHKTEFLEKFGVCKIGLFGSIARGEQTEFSDIDIAIEMDPGKKNLHNFLEFKRFLEKEFGKPVDLGIESTLKSAVKDEVKEEIIYV
jgi:predicted nucleotidyltransferase